MKEQREEEERLKMEEPAGSNNEGQMSVIEEAAVEQTLDEKEVDPLEENDNTDLKQAQGSE